MGATKGVVEYVGSNHEEHYNPNVPGRTDMGATSNSQNNNEQRKKLCNAAQQNI